MFTLGEGLEAAMDDFIARHNRQRGGVPKGIRTPVVAVKGRCPRPLDDGDQCNRPVLRVALSSNAYGPRTVR